VCRFIFSLDKSRRHSVKHEKDQHVAEKISPRHPTETKIQSMIYKIHRIFTQTSAYLN